MKEIREKVLVGFPRGFFLSKKEEKELFSHFYGLVFLLP